jgi:hypothetical protein
MKTKSFFLTIGTLVLMTMSSMFISSCTKEGPAGPAGEDGIDGDNANATCITCHDFSDVLLTKTHQYANSTHASGHNVDRSTEGCAQCHTSQGFRMKVDSGVIVAIASPAPINCRTCHKIHETYSTADYALRTSTAVEMIMGGPVASYDYGTSNICAECHQGRTVSPFPVAGGEPVTLTAANARFGPHHATQANMLLGKGAYEIAGSVPYSNSPHTSAVTNGCVTCHMQGAPLGLTAGGHQMGLSYSSYGASAQLLSGCTVSGCHEDDAVVKSMFLENRAEIVGLYAQLEEDLKTLGWINATSGLVVPGTYTQDQLGIILNLKYIEADYSNGSHNYRYTRALLVNSLEALAPKKGV